MNLRHLKYFVTIASLGSLRHAADSLYVSQSALSRAVTELERELDSPLLDRRARGVVPTPQGHLLLERARTILKEVDAARSDMQGSDGELAGVVTVAIPGSTRERLTKPLVARVRYEHPRVRLSIHEGTARDNLEQVAYGRVDLGITTAVDRALPAKAKRLFSERLCLVAPVGTRRLSMRRPVGIEALAEVPLVLVSAPSTARTLIDNAARRARLVLQPIVETASPTLLLDFVIEGLGYAVLPEGAIRQAVGAKRVVAAPIEGLSVEWRLVWSRDRAPSRAAQRIAELLVALAAA